MQAYDPRDNVGVTVDHSGSAPAVGNVLVTMPANAARRGIFVQNQSTNTLQVVLDNVDRGTRTVVIVGPAAAAGGQGGWWDGAGYLHLDQIRVCGPAGSQFAAGEF